MAQLHHDWAMLSSDYERLWHHWYEEDAESRLAQIQRRDREASQRSTEAPYDESLVDKWQDRVNGLRGVTTPPAPPRPPAPPPPEPKKGLVVNFGYISDITPWKT
jgi:hypothetical protein